jgi:hypothetical protein
MRFTPEVARLNGEDLDDVTPVGRPLRDTETLPENPFCGTKTSLIDAVVLGAIETADGVAVIVKEAVGGGGGGEELPPPPQLLRPTLRITRRKGTTAPRILAKDVSSFVSYLTQHCSV